LLHINFVRYKKFLYKECHGTVCTVPMIIFFRDERPKLMWNSQLQYSLTVCHWILFIRCWSWYGYSLITKLVCTGRNNFVNFFISCIILQSIDLHFFCFLSIVVNPDPVGLSIFAGSGFRNNNFKCLLWLEICRDSLLFL
jgi:hypothetical protein